MRAMILASLVICCSTTVLAKPTKKEAARKPNTSQELIECKDIAEIKEKKPESYVEGPCTASIPTYCQFEVEVEGKKYNYSYTTRNGEMSSCRRSPVQQPESNPKVNGGG